MVNVTPKPVSVRILSESQFSYKESDIKREFENHEREGYRLSIGPQGVFSYASSESGHFYASVTFKQIIAAGKIPHCEIVDYPRYSFRGYMLDTCRHFFTISEIKKQLDAIALLKINVFHWHLTEDQGWRIQIKKYPLLTEVGSLREGTRGDNIPVGGFYSQEDIGEVVKYAAKLNINVMPEIDIPGHFSAAIASYPYLSCDAKSSGVKDSFGIHEDVCCAGKETSYQFIEGVLDEVFAMFPFEYIHLGGDEALRIKWLKCGDCQKVVKDVGLKSQDELQAFFMARIASYAERAGKTVLNWNDGMVAENVGKNIVVHYWSETKINKEAAKRHINAGHKGVISPFFSYYLDYPYGMTSLKKTYKYSPENEGFSSDNILGLEAPLWTEYVEDIGTVEYMTYPRLIAVAEHAWSERVRDSYDGFISRAASILNIFDTMGINYAKISQVNPKGFKKIASLLGFLKKAKHPSAWQSMDRIKKNKKMLKEKQK